MAREITPRQQQVLDFISQSVAREGFPPTLEEIGAALGIRSPNAIRNHLLALEKKGYLTKEGTKSRAIRLTKRDRHGPIARLLGTIRRRFSVEHREIHLLQLYVGWCTKRRRPLLTGETATAVEARLRQSATERQWQITQLRIEPDHVLAGVIVGAGHSARGVVRYLKRVASAVRRLHHPHPLFDATMWWEKGFMATTDPSAVEQLMAEFLEVQPHEPAASASTGEDANVSASPDAPCPQETGG